MGVKVHIKRSYEKASPDDGYRVLIDRLWPRGLKKEDVQYDIWCKDLAPSPALRKWFDHKAEHWDEFVARYRDELRTREQTARINELLAQSGDRDMTLLYGAKDTEHNHARVLAAEIRRHVKA